jgi:hypothetical protein
VEVTLEKLASALRGQKVRARDLPDLREDHHRLAYSPDSRFTLVNAETDRMTNSLNTLREQIWQWQRLQ